MNPFWHALNALWWWIVGLLVFLGVGAAAIGVACGYLLWRAWRDIGRVR